MNEIKCPHCGKTKSKNKLPFTKEGLASHIKMKHKDNASDEYFDNALFMADMIAGDESDGVFWGIAFENGYFG